MSKIFLKTGKSRFLAHSQSVLSVSTFYLEFMFHHVFYTNCTKIYIYIIKYIGVIHYIFMLL